MYSTQWSITIVERNLSIENIRSCIFRKRVRNIVVTFVVYVIIRND